MLDPKLVMDEGDMRRLLTQTALEAKRETERWVMVWISSGGREIPSTSHDETLAWLAARITEEAWQLLGVQEPDAQAVLAWTIQEVIEWISHVVRITGGAGGERTVLTWHPVGWGGSLTSAVNERLGLLRRELEACGVSLVLVNPEKEAA